MKSELTLKKRLGDWKEKTGDWSDQLASKCRTAIGSPKLTRTTIDITAYLFVLLYIYTAYEKIKNHQNFEKTLSHSQLIGSYAWFVSWAVPVMEILVSLLLILPWQAIRKIALWSATVLIGLFSLYIIYMLLFVPAKHRTCECGGIISTMKWQVHLLFNSFYLIIGIDAIRLMRSKLKPPTMNSIQ